MGESSVSKPVLVVDDDAEIRQSLCQILSDEGYEVATAENGAEALAWLRSHDPAVILLDLMMPVMNGWQFLEAQVLDPAIASIPVVVLSAHNDARLALRGADFLSKPLNLDRLLEMVSRHA